jgi:oligopeptidase B
MKNLIWAAALPLLIISCDAPSEDSTLPMENKIEAPVAAKKAKELTLHGDTRVDNYFWMRLSDDQKNADSSDAQTQEVLDNLTAENSYSDKMLAHTKELQETLYEEIVGRIKQTDQSVPTKVDGFWYYTRYEEGEDYAFYCRKAETMDADEEIMLNGPEMGNKHSYFSIAGRSVSTNNNLLAYGVDTISRRRYTIQFMDLTTGELLKDKIENTTGGATWANDNKTVFYTRRDQETLRSYQIYKHVLGTDPATDELVFEETDETFSCFVYKTKTKKFIMIGSSHTLSQEYRFLDADTPNGDWTILQPRERGLEYGVAHFGDDFYIKTNLDAQNFRLMKAPTNASSKENWVEVIGNRDDVLLEGVEIFKDYLVVEERREGLNQIRVIRWDDKSEHYMEFSDPAYSAGVGYNPDFDSQIMRYNYSSMTTPSTTSEYNLDTRESVMLKQQEVVSDTFSPDNYTSERIMVTARDGKLVPMSLVYKKGTPKDGTAPLLLYAYGSYGSTIDAGFSSVRLSLLDRGFMYAIAHIRGSETLGRAWYDDGKLLNKKNSFYDFIDCGQYLVDKNYTDTSHLYAMGGSAGGLLMGGIMNMAPDLWDGVVAAVPFVDVVSTMLDETIPLTTFEWDEWGNPADKEYYDYMKSYSPYDQVEAKNYPNTLVTTGYWDSQVQYWEPQKWVAKLRDMKTDDNTLIMTCDMEAGHGGASGRLKRHKENALIYAFLLDLAGHTK